MIQTPEQKIVDTAITSRRAIRRYLPTPVAREDIEAILDVAARAPSGTNTQPWKVYVLTGPTKETLSNANIDAYCDPQHVKEHAEQCNYYAVEWVSHYIDRRRKIGCELYGLLKLTRENNAGMHAQHGRNYVFFHASVGFIFTIDRIQKRKHVGDRVRTRGRIREIRRLN